MEQHKPVSDEVSGMACTVLAQQYAVDYLQTHPDWMLKGWRCERGIPPQSPA